MYILRKRLLNRKQYYHYFKKKPNKLCPYCENHSWGELSGNYTRAVWIKQRAFTILKFRLITPEGKGMLNRFPSGHQHKSLTYTLSIIDICKFFLNAETHTHKHTLKHKHKHIPHFKYTCTLYHDIFLNHF